MLINESHLIYTFFSKYLRIKGVLVDVGAHVGNSLRPFADSGWEVHAFEPEKNNYNELSINYKNYHNVITNQLAVSNETGKQKFYISSKHWGIHSLKPFENLHDKVVDVNVIKLASYIQEKNISNVDFLKIDTEGADYLVLKGFDFDIITPKIVMAEYMDTRSQTNYGYSYSDMAKFFIDIGYDVYMFNWSDVVGGYSIKGIDKSTTNFVSFNIFPTSKKLYWGNIVAVEKSISMMFFLYIKIILIYKFVIGKINKY